MSIKDYFHKANKRGEVRTKLSTLQSKVVETDQTESLDYLRNFKRLKETYYPPVDFKNPDNFSKYSNPFDAYEVSIRRIYEAYPYDGTLAEKINWQNQNSFLDRDLFENDYPRQTGFITLSSSALGWGSKIQENSSYLYGYSSDPEYLSFFGGPNTGINGAPETRESFARNSIFFGLKHPLQYDFTFRIFLLFTCCKETTGTYP